MTLLPWILAGAAVPCAALSAAALVELSDPARRQDQLAHSAELDQARANLGASAAMLVQIDAEYLALLSGCGSGVFVLDSNDAIERASPEACRLMGLHQKQLEGRSLLQATLSADLQASVRLAHEENCIQRCEIRAPGMSGSCLNITIVPVSINPGAGLRCLVIANDVTELRRLETIRRDFVANVSHELRTPLTSIRAMAETLKDGALRDGTVAEHFLETISNEVQRLTRISEDLLILSQAESSQAETSRVSLSILLDDVTNRFQKQAEKDGIKLQLIAPAALFTNGSPDQIEQVIINLIDNAIKYTHSGGSVSISAEQQDQMVAVHVADTGIGIMSQDVSRIFERFGQCDEGTVVSTVRRHRVGPFHCQTHR